MLALELRVGGQEEVLVVDLDAVAGVKDERRIGVLGAKAEGTERPGKGAVVGVVELLDLEVEMAQRLGDPSRVVVGVRQRGRELVFADADDERHSLVVSGDDLTTHRMRESRHKSYRGKERAQPHRCAAPARRR